MSVGLPLLMLSLLTTTILVVWPLHGSGLRIFYKCYPDDILGNKKRGLYRYNPRHVWLRLLGHNQRPNEASRYAVFRLAVSLSGENSITEVSRLGHTMMLEERHWKDKSGLMNP